MDTSNRSTDTPLFVRFHTSAGWYAYDGPTGLILRLTPAMHGIVGLYHARSRDQILTELAPAYPIQELGDAYACIDGAVREQGVLANRAVEPSEPFRTIEDLCAELAKGTPQCTLQVTQNCNMRCAYCTYSEGYPFHRIHSAANMDWPTAKAAIDLLVQRNERFEGEFVAIGFYGGEPLLRFDLVRQTMEYAKTQPALTAHNLCFNMTINGTLLNDEIIRYLADNNATVLISLDGPREIHDSNRVFADGSPTFDRVVGNARRIQELVPDYFRRRVSFSLTIAPEADLFALQRFLEESDLFQRYRLRVGYVAPGNVTYVSAHPPHPQRHQQQEMLFQEFVEGRIRGQEPSKLAIALFEAAFVRLHRRTVFRGPIRSGIGGGACFPGGRKMYVSCDGALHICEKMNPHYPIGHVHSGIDARRVADLLSEYHTLMSQEDCRTCWAFRLCPMCFATLDGRGHFLPASKEAACAANRAAAMHDLEAYCAAQERKPDVWKYLDAYTVG